MTITPDTLNALVHTLTSRGWRLVEDDLTQDWYDGPRGRVARLLRVLPSGAVQLERAAGGAIVICDPDDARVGAFVGEEG